MNHGELYYSRVEKARQDRKALPVMGIYDCFSAIVMSEYFDAIFCSGYGITASKYGLPDVGILKSADIIELILNTRRLKPDVCLMADIDDGIVDINELPLFIKDLERSGCSAIIVEDQARPKKCGHLDGKSLKPIEAYLVSLEKILSSRDDLYVVARTDGLGVTPSWLERVDEIVKCGPNCIQVEGIDSLSALESLRSFVPDHIHLQVNMIEGGKLGATSLLDLAAAGCNVALYSTPGLFSTHFALNKMAKIFQATTGEFDKKHMVLLSENNNFLNKVFQEALKR